MLKVFSFGGGVQSVAALVLAARGDIDYRLFLFSNVGADSENPKTLEYFKKYARPYAYKHGLFLHELRRQTQQGREETLLQWLTKPESKTIGIPVRMANGAPGNRSCTAMFKIRVIAKWLREHGATPEEPSVVGLGISLDEFQRMRNSSGYAYYTNAYPLIDLRMTREDCVNLIKNAGLPIPPKSSCWFCPFHKLSEWQEMRENHPQIYAKAVALEQEFAKKRQRLGKDAVFLTSKGKFLPDVIGTADNEIDDITCDTGHCFV